MSLTSSGESLAELLGQAYTLAFAERMAELEGRYVARFDKRGLHPYSVVWGQIMAIETSEDNMDTSPERLRRRARAEADLAHFDRQRDVLTRDDYVERVEEAKRE